MKAKALLVLLLSPCLCAYVSPTTGKEYASGVARAFDKPAQNWHRGHRGVDLAARPGASISAAGDGRVSYVGVIAGTPVVAIEHPDGIKTTYQPVHALVRTGDQVQQGQTIGRLAGSEGLHWGALVGPDDYINPLSLLKLPTIRLKPVDGPDQRLLSIGRP